VVDRLIYINGWDFLNLKNMFWGYVCVFELVHTLHRKGKRGENERVFFFLISKYFIRKEPASILEVY
jgi:hypothetical protein